MKNISTSQIHKILEKRNKFYLSEKDKDFRYIDICKKQLKNAKCFTDLQYYASRYIVTAQFWDVLDKSFICKIFDNSDFDDIVLELALHTCSICHSYIHPESVFYFDNQYFCKHCMPIYFIDKPYKFVQFIHDRTI